MNMNTLKTQANSNDLNTFLASVMPEERQTEARALIARMEQVSGQPPILWGKDLIGFGHYQYTYKSGHSGEWFRMGFSPRKTQLVLYVSLQLAEHADLLARMGKHKTGKACLYLPKWELVNQNVLEELLQLAWAAQPPSEIPEP
jgi:hypothetical protein